MSSGFVRCTASDKEACGILVGMPFAPGAAVLSMCVMAGIPSPACRLWGRLSLSQGRFRPVKTTCGLVSPPGNRSYDPDGWFVPSCRCLDWRRIRFGPRLLSVPQICPGEGRSDSFDQVVETVRTSVAADGVCGLVRKQANSGFGRRIGMIA